MKTSSFSTRATALCAAAAALGAGTLAAAQPTSRVENLCRTVQANAPWQGTGVSVGPGQFVCVAADGLWSHGNQGVQAITPFYGPEGFGKTTTNTVPEVASRIGALIGRIGTDAPFLIEKQLCFIPASSGELRLSMNDESGAFANNAGSMRVQIARWANYRWAPNRIRLEPERCSAR